MSAALHRLLGPLLVAILIVAPMAARADYFVVVQANSPQTQMSRKEVVDLFMGRVKVLVDGEFAQVYDLGGNPAAHDGFFQTLTGMDPAQVNSYWSRLTFSGRSLPPRQVTDEAAMIEQLKRNPRAVGWLPHEPSDRQLRVVLVLKE